VAAESAEIPGLVLRVYEPGRMEAGTTGRIEVDEEEGAL
jgi:hypothetical protein